MDSDLLIFTKRNTGKFSKKLTLTVTYGGGDWVDKHRII